MMREAFTSLPWSLRDTIAMAYRSAATIEKISWLISLVATAYITRLVVRRKQSRWRLKEAERELRAEKAAHQADREKDRQRIDEILKRSLPAAVEYARSREQANE
jgi:hypothetical protein